MGLMSIYEVSYGRYDRSCFYANHSIYMAIDMRLHARIDSDDISKDNYKVRLAIFWRASVLDQ
jgi:hypothetical protein